MDDYHWTIVSACSAVILGIYAVRWYTDPLRAIPTVGGSDLPGLSYIGALRMQGDCRDVLEEGYRKYPDSAFKVALLDKWMVLVSGRNMVEELRARGDGELSGPGGAKETLQAQYLFERPVIMHEYHVEAVKDKLTRRLAAVLPGVIDEVVVAVEDHIAGSENEWTSVEIMPVMQKIVARASNRAFVGLPLCRNEEYLALAVGFSVNFMKSVFILHLLPRFLKPVVAIFANFVKRDTQRAVSYLRPLIEERQRAMAELGEGWNDKPNDVLQFLLDKTTTKNETPFVIAQRLLTLNFAAIHTSSATITHALYHLAAQPIELVAPLREEIEARIAADGWSAAALGSMWMLDSLLRETLRHHGVRLLAMERMAMKDLTLHDGTRIPRGTHLSVPADAVHHDGALLEDAGTFDAFRFARMRMRVRGAEDQDHGARYQFARTSPEYIPFGYGQHACPGRYFAAGELKAILAHIVLNYDLKLDGDGGGGGSPPADVYVATGVVPAPRGRVLFRKRGGLMA